jgi:hypothetical protein
MFGCRTPFPWLGAVGNITVSMLRVLPDPLTAHCQPATMQAVDTYTPPTVSVAAAMAHHQLYYGDRGGILRRCRIGGRAVT